MNGPEVYTSPRNAARMSALLGGLGQAELARQLREAKQEVGYAVIPYRIWKEATTFLDAVPREQLYEKLRRMEVPEEKLAQTLQSMGIKVRQTPGCEPGWTAFGNYFATGEGYHAWSLYDPNGVDAAGMIAAWRERFFAGKPDQADFFEQGLEVIRGHLKSDQDPEAEAGTGIIAWEYHHNDS